MAAVWVVFGHSAVISKNEKWLAPGTRGPHTGRALDHCTTASPICITVVYIDTVIVNSYLHYGRVYRHCHIE